MAFADTIPTAPTLPLPIVADAFGVGGTDVDMFGVELIGGRQYLIDSTVTSGDPFMRVFDAQGNELRADDDSGLGLAPQITFLAPYTGTYYVATSGAGNEIYDPNSFANRFNGLSGSGTVSIATPFFEQFFPGSNSAAAVGVTETTLRDDDGQARVEYTQGSIDVAGDADVGRFVVAKGDVIVIDVNGQGRGGVGDPLLQIRDSLDNVLQSNTGSGTGLDAELVHVATSGLINIAVLDAFGGIFDTGTGEFDVIIHRNPTQVGTSGVETITGTVGDDYIVALAGADTVNAGTGNDVAAGGDDNDTLNGGAGNDQLYGEWNDDTLNGGSGNDVLVGGQGDDTVNGSSGDDILDGGAGLDTMIGGVGADVARGGQGGDTITLQDGNDTAFGGDDADTINGDNDDDVLNGEGGNDTLSGGADDDTLDGGADNDTLNGNAGNDTLIGGAGVDTLNGGGDNDILRGGLLGDTLTGGSGTDSFDYDAVAEGIDTITDFLLGTDVIDLSTIFDATGSVVNVGNLAFFVQCTPAGGGADSFLAVDADGAVGGLSFTTVAQVTGVVSADLFDIANFIV